MRRPSVICSSLLLTATVCAIAQLLAGCNGGSSISGVAGVQPIAPVANACPREGAGSVLQNPPDWFSKHGILPVSLVLFSGAEIPVRGGCFFFLFGGPGPHKKSDPAGQPRRSPGDLCD